MAAAALVALLAGMTATPGMAYDADRTVRKNDSTTQGKVTEKPRFARQHVTLITGDRVTVEKDPTGRESISVAPAEGREHITFLKRQDRGE